MVTIDIEKVKKGLRYCQADENDDLVGFLSHFINPQIANKKS